MIRHSRFEPEEIEREKGVIVEEMNMYFDTPRDYLGGLYEQLLYGDQPLGWDIIGRKETVRGATRETFLEYLDRWYQPTRLVVGVGGKFDAEPAREARGARVGLPPRRDARRRTPSDSTRTAGRAWSCTRRRRTRRTCRVGVRSVPDRAPRPLRAAAAVDGARRRDVVAALHRGARAARARLLRLRRQQQLHGRRLALLAEQASTSTESTRPSRRSCARSGGSPRSRCRKTSS